MATSGISGPTITVIGKRENRTRTERRTRATSEIALGVCPVPDGRCLEGRGRGRGRGRGEEGVGDKGGGREVGGWRQIGGD